MSAPYPPGSVLSQEKVKERVRRRKVASSLIVHSGNGGEEGGGKGKDELK